LFVAAHFVLLDVRVPTCVYVLGPCKACLQFSRLLKKSRTLASVLGFPLGLDSCLIITHLQLVRNLWSVPTEFRENPRYYDRTMKHLGDIQYGGNLRKKRL